MTMQNMIGVGHQILLKVNGVEIGAARNMDINQDFGVEPAYVIGSILPVEHTPQRWSGTIDLDKFFIRRDIGIGANIDVSSEGVLTIQPLDVEVIDKDSNQTLLVAQGCTLQSSSITIGANAFIGERATLTALRIVKSEIGKSIVKSGI